MKNALKEQVGGSHYKDSPIQPVEYSHANKLGFIEGSVVKYVSRHRQKNGRQDIEKAIHLLKILLDLEYPNEASQDTELSVSGIIDSSGSITTATVDPKVFYHKQPTK